MNRQGSTAVSQTRRYETPALSNKGSRTGAWERNTVEIIEHRLRCEQTYSIAFLPLGSTPARGVGWSRLTVRSSWRNCSENSSRGRKRKQSHKSCFLFNTYMVRNKNSARVRENVYFSVIFWYSLWLMFPLKNIYLCNLTDCMSVWLSADMEQESFFSGMRGVQIKL